MSTNTKVLSLVVAMACPLVTNAAEPVIPVVPIAAQSNLPQPMPSDIKEKLDRRSILMKSGVNEIVSIAMGHMNRIVTPFDQPKAKTASSATIEIDKNVVYVSTSSEEPVTLFITDGVSQDQALSLTLIPQRIPPREVSLELPAVNSYVRASREREAEKWERSEPYLSVIQELFKSLALGQLPPGYQFAQKAEGQLPACRQTGLTFDFTRGQTVVGHSFIVHIGTATNYSQKNVEFVNETCGDWNIAAVSSFPLDVLGPSQKTEVYVVEKKNYAKEISVKRPSLLERN